MAFCTSTRSRFFIQGFVSLCLLLPVLSSHAKTSHTKTKKSSKTTVTSSSSQKNKKSATNSAPNGNGLKLRDINKSDQRSAFENFLEPTATPYTGITSHLGSTNFSLKSGCAGRNESISTVLQQVGVVDRDFLDSFDAQAPGFFKSATGKCLPYAVSVDSSRHIQSLSILNSNQRDKNTRLMSFNKSPTTGTYLVQSQDLSYGFKGYEEVELNLDDVVVYKSNKATNAIPPELVWELSSLIKEMNQKSDSNHKHFVRVIFNAGDKSNWAQIIGLEILDETRKVVIADGFWVDREDIPGGFFNSEGGSLEQEFWANPLNYRRISRGIGSTPGKAGPKRTQVIKKGKKFVIAKFSSNHNHQGIDYAAPPGTPIYAVANGKVIHYGEMSGYGNLVILEHAGGYKTYYAHLSAYNPELEVGSDVRRGLEIGYVGSTGHSTGPHLHFELREDSNYLNPLSEKLDINLWKLRAEDQERLTRQIVLFSSMPISPSP